MMACAKQTKQGMVDTRRSERDGTTNFTSGNGINHDDCRASWTTWEWVQDMYNHVYELWIDGGYAEVLEVPE